MNKIKEFYNKRVQNIKQQAGLPHLKDIAIDFINTQFPYQYTYHFDWLGRPIIQLPQDIVAMQEIIWKIKPDLIIETGIAHGGSLIFYASMLELLGKGEVLGIDIDIRKHNRIAIEKHPCFKRIKLIEGSSVDEKIVGIIKKIMDKHQKILVILDSSHTEDHVLKELNLYSKFVSVGSYLVVFDTIIEFMPKKFFSNRPWSKGNNPFTAVKIFLQSHKNFIVDKNIEDKLLITAAPGGYLKKVG